ncbi:MAG: aminodeoxychorismate lyase, partial [Methylococcales bacterium]|nr:aminodeoxychorismate lyase [Methylococcales bacterium]
TGCQRLLIPTPDITTLKKEAFQLSQGSKHAVLKLMVTRGSGGRGYRQPDDIQTTRLFSLHPYPDYPESFKEQGINIRICHARLGLNPSLAGIKHMNRLEQVLARAEWDTSEIQEGLMLDINGQVIEGTMSNVFLVKDNCLYTPEITQCGVKGILRDIIIQLANTHQIPVVEKTISIDEVYSADELFVSNSIIGIWPVKQIEDKHYKVGLLTRKLQAMFLDFKQQEIYDC